MSTGREIESKLEVPLDLAVPDLAGLPEVASVDAPEDFDLEAVYLDTPDLVLAKAGITLRRRTGGQDAGWHLKLPVSADERTEVQAPLGPVDGPPPAELLAALSGHVRDAQLSPVAVLHTSRSVRRLRDAAGRVLAEVADDVVTSRAPVDGQDHLDSWREWEIELDQGDRALLAAAVNLLQTAGAATPAWSSKLARALGGRLIPADDLARVEPDSGSAGSG